MGLEVQLDEESRELLNNKERESSDLDNTKKKRSFLGFKKDQTNYEKFDESKTAPNTPEKGDDEFNANDYEVPNYPVGDDEPEMGETGAEVKLETEKEDEVCFGYLDDICNRPNAECQGQLSPERKPNEQIKAKVVEEDGDDSTVYNIMQQTTDDVVPPVDITPSVDIAPADDSSFDQLHENFEVVLDPNCFSPPEEEKKEDDDMVGYTGVPVTRSPSTMEIQKDLEVLEASRMGKKRSGLEDVQEDQVLEACPGDNVNVQNQSVAKDADKEKRKKTKKLSLFKKLSFKKKSKSPGAVEPKSNFTPQPKREEKAQEPLVKPTKPKQTWKSVVDANSGKPYYYHRKTRETTWTEPDEHKAYPLALLKYQRDMKKYEEQQAGVQKEDSEELIQKKEEIRALFAQLSPAGAPPDAADQVLKLYEGREDKLLSQLREKNEPQPFDEPAPSPSETPAISLSEKGRTGTHISRTSTTVTEKTQRIANIDKNKTLLGTLSEDQSSISSVDNTEADLVLEAMPSRVHVRRERALMVEDLGSSRIAAETYDRYGRITKGRDISEDEDDELYSENANDVEENVADTKSSATISALSENDNDDNRRKENFEHARRRALYDAIEREDWDLAAALSEGMGPSKSTGNYAKKQSSWNRSDVDKFIAKNDWSAVKQYISMMRDKKASNKVSSVASPDPSDETEDEARLATRAKSRPQKLGSKDDESWSSGSGDSSDSYESGYSQ